MLLAPGHLVDPDLEQVLQPVGSSSSPLTRLMIRPTVDQSIRTSRLTVVLSALLASHATSCSKSRVNPLP
jgi:hypothetical protein